MFLYQVQVIKAVEGENMKSVSIIIPVYNLEKYLVQCLESVINQSHRNLEIVLLDDGSCDQSLKICKDFESRDNRVKVFSHPNKGVSYTRNRGIEVATGKYLMFIDGDDYLEPFWVESYVKAAEKSKADIVIGGLTFLLETEEMIQKKPLVLGEFTKNLWNCICTKNNEIYGYVPNKLYRTELIKSNGVLFDETMKAQEDLDFALSAYHAGEKFILIDECGYIYRYVPGKRNHPKLQYMKNQLKLLKLAKDTVELQKEQENVVIQKILDYLYTYIYYLPIDEKFADECQKIEEQEGLREYLIEYSGTGEQAFVSKMVFKKKYRLLKKYFCVRHALRRCLGRARK